MPSFVKRIGIEPKHTVWTACVTCAAANAVAHAYSQHWLQVYSRVQIQFITRQGTIVHLHSTAQHSTAQHSTAPTQHKHYVVGLTSCVIDLLIQVSNILGSVHSVRYATLCAELSIPCSEHIWSDIFIFLSCHVARSNLLGAKQQM